VSEGTAIIQTMIERTGGQARRHHVVSKFYLKYFADDREQLTTVMLPGDRTFTQSVADASVNIDFYTVVDITGQQSDIAERALSQLEGPAASAWREMNDGVWPLPEEHRVAMATWLALQLLRGTGVRNSMSELATHALLIEVVIGGRRRMREALTAAGEPADDATVDREWVAFFKDPFRAKVHANHHIEHVLRMLPRVTESLLDRCWLLTMFERKKLATSDHPVHVVSNRELTQVGMGTGIENANVIHAPLTRRHSLAMYLPSAATELAAHGDIAFPGVAATALYSNSSTVYSARRFLFHHPATRHLPGSICLSPANANRSFTPNCGSGYPKRTATSS
jgi:hypothetical protein